MEKLAIIPDVDSNICCDRILVEMEDGILRSVAFDGGCDGNGKALGRLLQDMPAEQAIKVLAGVDCGGKGSSCADQFAVGLRRALQEQGKL